MLAAPGVAPSTADTSLFLRTDTSLSPFYILVYIDDLVIATADTEALALVKSELHKRHTCTDLGELCSYLGLQITWDRARRTITLTLSHMVHQVLQRFGFRYSLPQSTPLPTGHSLTAPPSDESVEPNGPYPELVGCLMYLMTCTRPDLAYPLSILARYVAPGRHQPEHWEAAKRVLRYLCSASGMGLVLGGRGPVVLTGYADTSWIDDLATERSSHGAMAAQELCWLTYLLTDFGERPRSPPVLYVDDKAMIALCQEHRLEHRTKHIALRYFLARELQQRGKLCLAYVATRVNTADIFTKALQPGMSISEELAASLGVAPSLITLLLCLFSSIPAALVVRFFPGPTLKHLYSIAAGGTLCWVAYGGLHASLNFWGLTLASYALMLVLPRKWSGYGVLFGSFTYLTYCHISNLGADVWRQGGVDFTGTLMVFTLKISGCAMDYQDGALPEDKAQHRMYSNRLARLPSVVEFVSFVFFPGAALVGPVFNLKQYQAYAAGQGLWSPSGVVVPSKAADTSKGEEGQQAQNENEEADRAQGESKGEKVCKGKGEGKGEGKLRKMPEPLPYAAQALGKAIIFLAMHHFLSQHFGPALLFQPRFLTYGFAYKWFCLVVAGICFRCSYYFIWSVAEAAVILSGFGFSGWSDSFASRPDWSRAENAYFVKCEITASMAQVPSHWNMGVGTWLRTYVYDRVTPRSGKPTMWTLVFTQVVSALWHGLHPGYYLFFVNGAIGQHTSKLAFRHTAAAFPEPSAAVKVTLDVLQAVFKMLIVNYSFAGFLVLQAGQTIAVWRSLFFMGTIVPILLNVLLSVIPTRSRRHRKKAE
ncbi:unnamed protein product [Closterium sp. NIES-54]